MPSNDVPRRATNTPPRAVRRPVPPPEPLAPPRSGLIERELAHDLAVLIERGLIVEVDMGGTTRYAVASACEQR